MDPILLARLQFGITTVYHFFFVPLTLGLSVLVAIMETMYVRSGNAVYKQMTKFWGKLFLINFAMGVVTGIVQEFQFGMNWSEYSRMVGDIFGAPLAIEALLAFFMESTFLGVWVFGWDKLSKKAHAAVIWLVAIGSNLSALWILIANSFMQEPVGYALRNGRAEMESFLALITNPNVLLQFPHVITSALTTASFFVLGISVYQIFRKKQPKLFWESFRLGAITGVVGILLVTILGHAQAQHMTQSQPMKMASAEALWHTENPASFSLITIGDFSQKKEVFSIRIPYLLSLLVHDRFDGEVKGVYDLQDEYVNTYGEGDYIPPVAWVYWSFRIMVGAGLLMLVMAFYALYLKSGKKHFPEWLKKAFVYGISLPYLANSAGWIMTEVGRSPWVVFGLLKYDKAVSKAVSSGELLITLIGFTLLYGVLMVADVYLLVKYVKLGAEDDQEKPSVATDAAVSFIGAQG